MDLIQGLISGISAGAVYAVLAIGISLVYRITGVINFAHGDIAVFGAYIAYSAHLFVSSIYLAATIGILASALLGVLFDRAALRFLYARPVIWAVLGTVGLSLMIESAIQIIWGATPLSLPSLIGRQVIRLDQVAVPVNAIGILALSGALTVALNWFVEHTKYGRAMRACSQDREVSEILGIPTNRLYLWAFAMSGASAALAGVLVLPTLGLLPSSGLNLTVLGFSAAIVGGLGSMPAALFGGVAIGVLQTITGIYVSANYANAVVYLAIVVVLAVRVQGIFGDTTAGVRSV